MLRHRLTVELVGTFAQFIDGVPIVKHWDWTTPRNYDIDPGGEDNDDNDDSDENDAGDERARLLSYARLPYRVPSYFGDHYGEVRSVCDSSDSTHNSDSNDGGMPRFRFPRAERRHRAALLK